MKFSMAAIVVAMLLATIASNARTKDKCYKVKCRGTADVCISAGGHGTTTAGIPGVAEITQIPCSSMSIGTPNTYHDNVFIHDPTNSSLGIGYINADVLMTDSEAAVTTYDDTQQFTDFESWLNALP